MKPHRVFAAALILSSASLAQSNAREPNGTLAKIKQTGTITLGVRDGSIPFFYLDDKQKYIGYSVDLCMKVVDALRTEIVVLCLAPSSAVRRVQHRVAVPR
jgi:glutamate/aspartate transport system substrate-binding protein